MLPKIDSTEWKETWNLETKINALNEAIQHLNHNLSELIANFIVESEVENAREDRKKAKSTGRKK